MLQKFRNNLLTLRTGFKSVDFGLMVHRAGVFAYRKLFGHRKFTFADKEHSYLIHPFVLYNERAVEVGVAREFLRDKTGEILEVGNVLANFAPFPHDVVDKYEKSPGVINEDIVTYSPGKKYDAIVTLSTLEHVGWDEQPREPEKIVKAIEHLKELLKEGGQLLATVPMGYNSYLDELIKTHRTGFSEVRYLLRVSADNQWKEARFEEAKNARFGTPYSCANAVMVGYYRKGSA